MIPRKPFAYIRHGQTGYNANDWYCGSHNIPLNEIGEQQARDASPLLNYPWSCVTVSPLLRAQQTARLAVPMADLVIDHRFAERHFGDDEGQPIQRPINHLQTPPNGEAWEDFCQRIEDGLSDLLAQHDLPLVVAHGAVYRGMYYRMFGSPDCEPFPNATPVLFEPVGGSGWRITALADLADGWYEQTRNA